jgi:hypothetical protein
VRWAGLVVQESEPLIELTDVPDWPVPKSWASVKTRHIMLSRHPPKPCTRGRLQLVVNKRPIELDFIRQKEMLIGFNGIPRLRRCEVFHNRSLNPLALSLSYFCTNFHNFHSPVTCVEPKLAW